MDASLNWSDDKIGGRQEAAKYLTKFMCDAYARNKKDEAFVVSLNAPWGFGKTFFLERWANDLRGLDHPVIYFDAWKTDFSDQPLLTFVVEFYNQIFEQLKDISRANTAFKMQMQRISKATLPMIKDALKHFTSVDLEQLSFGGLLRDYKSKQDGIEEFRKQINSLCETFSENEKVLPIFVFVDEMDRCRPDYAIELLESIKHIFGSKNLCFVIATDTFQLGESIKAVYGSGFDATRYLHRFFSQEYRLPEPDNEQLANYLFEVDPIAEDYLFNPSRESRQTIFAKLANLHKLSVREQIKAYELLRALVLHSKDGGKIDMLFATALIMLKLANLKHFDKLVDEALPQDKVADIYEQGNYNVKVWVEDVRIGANNTREQDNLKLHTVIGFYMRFINRDLFQNDMSVEGNSKNMIYRRIAQYMADQRPREYRIGDVLYPDVHDYPARIRQIGHLVE